MKKLLFATATLAFILMLTSCHHNRYRTTTIKMTNDSVSLKIKYSGYVRFNDDSTAIKSISPEGFLMYRKNDNELLAESDHQGQISLELNEHGKRLGLEDDRSKIFLAEAVKEMIAQGVHSRNGGEQH